jgi:peptide/nickel transport system substrate-binding protein
MIGGDRNFWDAQARRRLSRRALLRGTALAGAGLVGASLVACKGGAASPSGGTQKAPNVQATSAAGVNALVGRTGKPPAGQPVTGGTLNVVNGINPPTLDPHGSTSAGSFTAINPAMSRLLRFKSPWDVNATFNRETEADLATSVESPDAVTWTFHLRNDAKFQNIPPVNGHPVQAEDIKQTYLRATSDKNANHGSLGMIDPSQIQTPDNYTVVFKLKFPYAPFRAIVASGIYGWILPREIANDAYDPTKTLIGSGPFVLDKYTPDVELVYKKNPDWFEKGKPYIDGAHLAIVADPNAQIAQFEAGNLDYISSPLNDNTLPGVRQQVPTAELYTTWGPGDGQMYFPLGPESNSPFKDIRLRRGLSLLIDRDAITKVAFNGKAAQDFYTPLSFGKWALHITQLPPETAKYYKQDVQAAKQLIDAAGGGSLVLKMLSPYPFPPGAEPFWYHTMREMVANFLTLGPWKTNLVLIDYTKDWVNGGRGVRYGYFPSPNDSMVFAGLEGRQDVDQYVFDWYDSQSSLNCEHLHDDKLDSMIAKARTIVDDDQRAKAYIDLQTYMADQMFSVAGQPNGLSYTMIAKRVVNYTAGDSYGAGTGTWSNLWLQKA